MSHLSLAFLGAPQVHHAGRMLTFRTRKALGLLVYLAVAGGMHSRERLTALFWPESDEEQGRASLRNTLLYLRNALSETSDSPHLITERDALGFDFTSAFEIDVHTLQTAFKQARTHAHVEDLEARMRPTLLSQFQAAVEQYRGDFLDDFSLDDAPDFDDWMRLQRETWHRCMSTVFDRLSQVQFDGGELSDAIETTMRWVAHDPLNEAGYLRLMQVHFALGDRNAALHAYETCRSMLAKELHLQPAPETRALAERIRAKVPPRRASVPPTPTLQTMPVPAMLPSVPLIGRVTEYGRLIDAFRAAKLGHTQVVLLTGEAGIGKTRLASEFLGWAAAHGADVLQGRAFETGGQVPYQALVEALRSRVEQENAPDDLLSDTWLAELARMLPELRDRYPDLPSPPLDEATARIRLFESVVRLLQALAEHEPLVLFIDDVHWADVASLDILHYAGRRCQESNTPLMLLLNLRAEILAAGSNLTRWLVSLQHDLPTTSLTLGRLSPEDITHLVQALAQAGSASHDIEQSARWLFGETQGQPFYVLEMLKALRERGLLVPHLQADGTWGLDFSAAASAAATLRGMLPPGVREMIRSRLVQLPPTALTLLVAGAVLGHAFTFEQVCQVAGIGEQEGLVTLDELLVSQYLSESTGKEREAYFFSHDKIRDVAYTEAGEARRRVFHRRALDVLAAAAAPPAELAHHARASGLSEPTFHWSLAAGDAARRLFAVRDAIVHYEQARSVLTEQPGRRTFPASAIEHLYLQIGRAYELNSEFEQAYAVYQEMLAWASASGLATMEGAAMGHLATLAAQNPYDSERAMALLHQVLHAAAQSGETPLLAETEWNLAQLHVYRFEPTAALQHGAHALTVARQLGQQELIARSLNVIAYTQMAAGDFEAAETRAEEARALYAGLGNRAMEADSLCLIALNRIQSGRPQAGITAAQMAHRISLEIENAWGQVHSALPLAYGWLEMGAYSEALECAEVGVNLTRKASMTILLGLSLILLGAVQRARLSLDAARRAHLEARAMVTPAGVPSSTEAVAAELCADCAMAGEWEEAHAHALQALTARTDTFLHLTKLTLWCQTEAFVRAGEIERATEDVRRFGACIGNSRRYRIPYLRALAVLAKFQGEIHQPTQYLQEAARLSEEIGLPGELWSIQAARGKIYLAQGDQEQAHGAFKQAATIVRKLADALGNQEQRANFLSSPDVRHVLEA